MTATAHSLEAEKSVLGSILLDPRRALGPVREVLKPLDFFSHQHRRIYEAAIALEAAGKPVDVLTISEFLGSMLEACGGVEKLAELAGSVPTVENVAYHARIVAQKSLTRQVKAALGRAQASDAEGEELLSEALGELGTIHLPSTSHGETLRSAIIPTLNRVESGDLSFLGVPTGIQTLTDAMVFGVQRGVECVIAARPGMGKSSLCAQIARHVVEMGGTCDYYPIEDGKASLVLRLTAQLAQVDNGKLRSGKLSAVEWGYVHQAAGQLHSYGDRFDIIEDGVNPHDAEGFALQVKHRAMKKRAALASGQPWRHLIVVDYLQLLWLREFKGKPDRNGELTRINALLKGIPKACDCHLIVCSQLKRTDGPPQLSDLRDCGAIEQDAHQVIMLDRPDWLEIETDRGGKQPLPAAWAHIRKNKDGQRGTVPLSWRGAYVLFGDADDELREQCWAAHRAQNKRGKR